VIVGLILFLSNYPHGQPHTAWASSDPLFRAPCLRRSA
jgi:hypothetical protein